MPRSSASKYTSADVGCSSCGLDRPVSATQSDEAKNVEKPDREVSNGQLLVAVFHSERRAREAKRAAQEACNEKEHLITLFLNQASQMLAYKQWLYILKLETLCLQLRCRQKYQPIHTRFPDFVVWSHTPKKGTKRYKMHKYVGKFIWGLIDYLLLLYDVHFIG